LVFSFFISQWGGGLGSHEYNLKMIKSVHGEEISTPVLPRNSRITSIFHTNRAAITKPAIVVHESNRSQLLILEPMTVPVQCHFPIQSGSVNKQHSYALMSLYGPLCPGSPDPKKRRNTCSTNLHPPIHLIIHLHSPKPTHVQMQEGFGILISHYTRCRAPDF
jgi:hypothetical protein